MVRVSGPVFVALILMAAACAPPATERRPALRQDIELVRDSEVIEARVPRHATLAGLLRAHEVSEDLAAGIVDAVHGAFDLRRLRAEQPYRIERTFDGFVREFVYKIDADRFLRVVGLGEPGARAFDVEVVPYEKRQSTVALHGTIDREHNSLASAVAAHGESVLLAISLAEVFGGEIDFNNDLQPGDSFDVVFQKQFSDGEFARYGPIVAAEFRNDGRTLDAFRYQPSGGEPGYYDGHGRSMKRFFLRSPLKFEPRISSGFSYRRLHPVLGTWRAHPAIDYVAPVGAPVVAVAAGTVATAGWAGGAGRMITLRHNNGYESSYLHLSSIDRAVRPGARVAQGQAIGRVGATGLATGPHLDFRMKRNGAWVNPLVEQRRLPPGAPIAAAELAAFDAAREHALSLFAGHSSNAVVVAAALPVNAAAEN
jgi:murein DD-endopeptidase MepM/ murein hydrolase activator NlpD